jgi:tetratricopeptide (TPR) repeat protein
MSKPTTIYRQPLRTLLKTAVQYVFMTGALIATLAHADVYSDVNQLVRTGQLSQAMSKADQYLSDKPRDPQMRFLKGVIQTQTGKSADAIATFTNLTKDYPELPEPYNNLAALYAQESQFDKARVALEMAIRTNPSYATAHENLGDVYAKLASQSYSKALQLDSKNTSLQPKLSLISNLFMSETKDQKSVLATPANAATAATKKVEKSGSTAQKSTGG